MEKLLVLIKKLRTTEIRMLRRFLNSRGHEGADEKRLQLFELLFSSEIKTENEIAVALGYKSPGDKAYINLRSRLRDDILDILLLQENGKAFENNYAQAQFECRKRLMQGEILLARGCYEPALEILSTTIHLAHKFELHAELIQMTDVLRSHAIMRNDMEVYKELNELLHEATAGLSGALRARQLFYEITVPGLLEIDSLNGYRKHAGGLLAWMDNKTKRSHSPRIAFFRGLATVNYHATLFEFDRALTAGKKLLRLIAQEEILNCDVNRGGVCFELAALSLRTNRMTQAEEHIQEAISCFSPGLLNHFRASELLFFILLRAGKMEQANELLKKLETEHVGCDAGLHNQQIHFLYAVLCFYTGKQKKCTAQLKQCHGLQSGTSEWTPGYYLLDMFLKLESGDFDGLQQTIVQCRKKIAFAGYTRRMHPRLFLIIDLLMWISRKEDTGALFLHKKDEMLLLENGAGEYQWNPGGYEVVRFDTWIKSKFTTRLSA